jgi:hypothetical protein
MLRLEDDDDDEEEEEYRMDVWSRLTFSNVSRVLSKGYCVCLSYTDLTSAAASIPIDSTQLLLDQFQPLAIQCIHNQYIIEIF